jgi:hypothetical protein
MSCARPLPRPGRSGCRRFRAGGGSGPADAARAESTACPGRYLPVRNPAANEAYGSSTSPRSVRVGSSPLSIRRSTRLHLSWATVNRVSPWAAARSSAAPSRGAVKFEAPSSRILPVRTRESKAARYSSWGHLRVVAVGVVQVDAVGAQPAQGVLRGQDDVAGGQARPVALAEDLGVNLNSVTAAAGDQPVPDLVSDSPPTLPGTNCV